MEPTKTQSLGYTRTLIGHHAGLDALAILLLGQTSYYFGVVYWNGYGELKMLMCTKQMQLTWYPFFDCPCY